MSIIHKFESAGLGKAPFRLVGMFEKRCTGEPNAQGFIVGSAGQPAGTCDYCSTGIANCYQIKSADGKLFVVGEDCVRKTDDSGLVDTVKKAANKVRNQARRAKEQDKIAAATPAMKAYFAKFADEAHPVEYYAAKGLTMADYLQFRWEGCGNKGKLEMIKMYLS